MSCLKSRSMPNIIGSEGIEPKRRPTGSQPFPFIQLFVGVVKLVRFLLRVQESCHENKDRGESDSLGSTSRPRHPTLVDGGVDASCGRLRPYGRGGAHAVGSLGRASHAAPAALPLDVPPPVHVPRYGVLLSSDACQNR